MIKLTDKLNDLMKELKEFSSETYYHCVRVKNYTYQMLKLVSERGIQSFTPEEIDAICKGALLHDVGKLYINNVILTKDDRLTEEELREIREHTDYGVTALSGELNESEKTIIENICKYHHDRIDGRGFHQEKNIPLYVQIVSLCDAFEALCANRIYRPPYPKDKALAIIQDNGCGDFDITLVELLVEMTKDTTNVT